MANFGERFKELRLKKGFTQDQLVEEFNKKFNYSIGKSAISQYENNKRIPEINLLVDLAQYFGVTLDYLLCTNDLVYEERTKYDFVTKEDEMSLEKIVEKLIFTIKSPSKVYVEGKVIDKKARELFINCIEVGLELVKKDIKNE